MHKGPKNEFQTVSSLKNVPTGFALFIENTLLQTICLFIFFSKYHNIDFFFNVKFFLSFDCAMWYVRFQLLDQGQNLHPLHWKHRDSTYCTTREVPDESLLKGSQYLYDMNLYMTRITWSDPGDSCYYPVLTDLAKEVWGFKPTAALISFKLEVKNI